MSWPWQTAQPSTLKETIFREMRKFGADYMEASYSGGNDEGGVDDVMLFRRAAPRKRKGVVTRDVGTLTKFEAIKVEESLYDGPLWEAVDDLLSLDFGTWAGEFTAHGTVLADIETKRVWREGEVSTYSSDETAGEW